MAPHTTTAAGGGGGGGGDEEVSEAAASPALRHRHGGGKGAGEAWDDEGTTQRGGNGAAVAGDAASVERVFADKAVPSWREQLTLRAFVVSALLAVMFSVIVMKLNLTTGIIPSLNVSAGLLGFFFVRMWTAAVERMGFLRQPFTRQENTVIQTCVVSAYGIAFSGGFGSYLFGMSDKIARQATEAKDANNIKDPHLGWMIGFLFLVSFIGLLALVPLRKIMIVDYKLTYPSGTATAYLINGFHTPEGAKLAKKQVKTLGKYFMFSFFWGFFQWFYTAGDDCGFKNFPTLGLEAYDNRFYFDFSPTYVGVGMICPSIVNVSVLLGGILSWGVMWPLIAKKKGSWYQADAGDSSLHGLQAYRVFISIALILGDGLYNFIKVLIRTIAGFISMVQQNSKSMLPVSDHGSSMSAAEAASFDEERRTEIFLKDQIPKSVAYGGYVAVAAVSIGTLPQIFPQLKWYYIMVAYVVAPVLAFCNAYGSGLTDWSLASTYGKLAIFVFGAWAGLAHGGVLVGLAACGVMMSIVSTASDLMQDFKTGYLTLASPRSVHQPGDRNRDGVRHRALYLLAVLQGVRRHRQERDRVPGALRHRVPQHGHPRRGRLRLAAQELSHTLLHLLRGGDRHQPAEGPDPEQGVEVHPAADGDGDPLLHRVLLRHRHVPGLRDPLRVGAAEQGKGGRVRSRGRVGADLRGRDLDTAAVYPGSGQGEAPDLHEVSVESNQCQGGQLPRVVVR